MALAWADDDGPDGLDDDFDDRSPAPARTAPDDSPPDRGEGLAPEFERDEIVVFGAGDAGLRALEAQGFTVLHRRELASLGGVQARLRVPRAMSPAQATALAGTVVRDALVESNHLYRPAADPCGSPACAAQSMMSWPAGLDGCGRGITVGLIDTGVAVDHPALRGAGIEVHAMRSPDRRASAKNHGTAVASILAARVTKEFAGLLPGSRLVAVDAFHGAANGADRMDAFDLAAALDMLLARGVRTVNLSFAGPPNSLVERVLDVVERRGMLVVAAVGNDGPRAKPLYPAAYRSVVGVTAVDSRSNPYRQAGQGAHVELSAPGVNLVVAKAGGFFGSRTAIMSGTSLAAPFVTALAAAFAGGADVPADRRRQWLVANARDLGVPGHDPVFGHGVPRATGPCASPTRQP